MVRRVVQLHKLYQQLPECRRAEPVPAVGRGLPLGAGVQRQLCHGSGSASGISGACDLDRSYKDFLPEIKAGGYNNYGVSGPSMETVSGKRLVVFNARCEYFNTANFNDVVGYLPLGNYCVVKQSTRKYNGYDWVIFRYQGTEYWTAVIGDRNRVEDCNCDCN